MKKNYKEVLPRQGIEPGPAGWKAAMLTTTPPGILLDRSDKSKIDFMYIRADSALTRSLM